MPLYEFYCRTCNEKFTQLHPIATAGEPVGQMDTVAVEEDAIELVGGTGHRLGGVKGGEGAGPEGPGGHQKAELSHSR